MSHGNRTHTPPQPIHKEWEGVSNNKQDVSKWVRDCALHEKSVSEKNRIAREQFHSNK